MIQLIYEVAILHEYGLDYRWSTAGNFLDYFLINTFAFVLNGVIGGLLIVFFLQYWFRNHSYARGLLYGMGTYIVLFILLTCLQNYFVVKSIWDESTPFYLAYIQGLEDYFFSFEFARNFPFWLLILIGTLIILFINDKYGPGVLRKFLIGRYFRPRSEERIFMFLDLKGSTAIAEKLGEHQYFSFLQKVYREITPVLIETMGEVYQYVGDEVVVSWTVPQGIKNINCIRCFKSIQQLLDDRKNLYTQLFGVIPIFKAGIHIGRSVVGEIGVIKRDIAYSGDVLNTTSRIQSMCNELGASLLVSEDLLDQLPKDRLSPKSMGKIRLRGKARSITLYSL